MRRRRKKKGTKILSSSSYPDLVVSQQDVERLVLHVSLQLSSFCFITFIMHHVQTGAQTEAGRERERETERKSGTIVIISELIIKILQMIRN